MKLSPLHVSILLHYYSRPGQWGGHNEFKRGLCREGYLAYPDGLDVQAEFEYTLSNKGQELVTAILNIAEPSEVATSPIKVYTKCFSGRAELQYTCTNCDYANCDFSDASSPCSSCITLSSGLEPPTNYCEVITPLKPNSGSALRYDNGKPDFALLSPIALLYLTRRLDFGAKKYNTHNWRKGMDYSRILSSMQRHFVAYLAGQDIDPDGGEPHMSGIMFGAMALLEYQHTHPECDDRYKLPKEVIDLMAGMLAGAIPQEDKVKT